MTADTAEWPNGNTWLATEDARYPGRREDRTAYAALSDVDRLAVRLEVARLYDGTRTLAQCWRQAMGARS